jgi:two-component system chemotaxis response regulator CheB
MTESKIDVLVAEDSTVTRMFLVQLIESDPRLRVVGAVGDGQAAVEFVQRRMPDVVLMDIHMPRLDGFEATRRIMETQAVPIVICSANASIKDVVTTFQAMEAGAVACIEKPLGREHRDAEHMAAHLLETLQLMSEVRVVRRTARSRPAALDSAPAPAIQRTAAAQTKVIGIGASTGGPPVLRSILSGLPKNFPAPILIVQHMAPGFLAGMVEWLNQTISLQAHIGSHGATPLPGHVYLGGTLVLTRQEPENHLRPSVSFLFRSLARTYGPNTVGVLLTGMGRDGATELKLMRDRGAITIAQDAESSVVHGMPGAAIALGGASHVLPADEIAAALIELVAPRSGMLTKGNHERQ